MLDEREVAVKAVVVGLWVFEQKRLQRASQVFTSDFWSKKSVQGCRYLRQERFGSLFLRYPLSISQPGTALRPHPNPNGPGESLATSCDFKLERTLEGDAAQYRYR